MKTQEMFTSHPRNIRFDLDQLTACISACTECADSCTVCADACLGEEKVQMLVRCIGLNQDCADVCGVTARILARQSESESLLLRLQLETCATACRICAEECDKHAEMHRHCRVCANSCRNCEDKCRVMLKAMMTER
ncbi:four-helix bundle copper-binding protein [Geomesophilobacter sediminis]|uniref:Four-helix bundle copper-binding protein n=1 Tax=Geomesophilobacter sediminis TaxID=2798584 RepID=A0A8J7JCG5_9BACT|nr:four-helix bundle copper-binding protein [Geomesophilobacter sediminis]MBJ6724508.1 four-helix bundle copper-binding protein [Geomesophilobacter sediminis]